MLYCGIKEIDDCLKELRPGNLLLLANVFDFNYGEPDILNNIITNGSDSGEKIIYFLGDTKDIFEEEYTNSFKDKDISNLFLEENDSIFISNYRKDWTIEEIKDRLEKYENYDLVVIESIEDVVSNSGYEINAILLNEILNFISSLDVPVIIKKNVYVVYDKNEDIDYERIVNDICQKYRYYADLIAIHYNDHGLVKSTVLDCRIKRNDSFSLYQDNKDKYLELKDDDLKVLNNAKAIGLNNEDAVEFLENYLENRINN